MIDLVLLVGMVGLGLAWQRSAYPGSLAQSGQATFKAVLAVSIPFYLGLRFDRGAFDLASVAQRMLRARALGLALPLVLLATGGAAAGFRPPTPVLAAGAVFLVLPVSSLAPGLMRPGPMHDQAILDTVGSTIVFVVAAAALAILGNAISW